MKALDYDIIVAGGGGTAGAAAAIAAARRGWHVLLVIALPCLGRTPARARLVRGSGQQFELDLQGTARCITTP